MTIYLIVPADLADRLHRQLRGHFREELEIRVIVDRRGLPTVAGPHGERRRAVMAAVVPSLPAVALGFVDRLEFREIPQQQSLTAQDDDSLRLVKRFHAGDAAAFDDLYARYFDSVYSYLLAALQDSHDAEDLTQHVWLRAYGALGRYEQQGSVPFRGWLFLITRRILIDELRRRGRVRHGARELLEQRLEHTSDPDLGRRWFADPRLELALDELTLAQRQVVLLRFLLGLTYAEIAHATGKSEPALRQLNSRALQDLGRAMQNSDDPPRSTRSSRDWMRMGVRPMPVLRRRRFCLWECAGIPAGLR